MTVTVTLPVIIPDSELPLPVAANWPRAATPGARRAAGAGPGPDLGPESQAARLSARRYRSQCLMALRLLELNIC